MLARGALDFSGASGESGAMGLHMTTGGWNFCIMRLLAVADHQLNILFRASKVPGWMLWRQGPAEPWKLYMFTHAVVAAGSRACEATPTSISWTRWCRAFR